MVRAAMKLCGSMLMICSGGGIGACLAARNRRILELLEDYSHLMNLIDLLAAERGMNSRELIRHLRKETGMEKLRFEDFENLRDYCLPEELPLIMRNALDGLFPLIGRFTGAELKFQTAEYRARCEELKGKMIEKSRKGNELYIKIFAMIGGMAALLLL